MDVTSPALAPRVVADLRPAADAAATSRVEEPPAALALGPAIAPVSSGQEGLVTRGLMESAAAWDRSPRDPGKPLERVLKPWGVPMLPAEESRPDQPFGPEGTETAGASGPAERDVAPR